MYMELEKYAQAATLARTYLSDAKVEEATIKWNEKLGSNMFITSKNNTTINESPSNTQEQNLLSI